MALIAVGNAAWSGCSHAPVAAPPEGRSAFRFVEPPPPPAPATNATITEVVDTPVQTLLVAVPIQPLARPVYPAVALGAQKTPVLIGVRIAVDVEGRVTNVQSSLFAMSTPTRFDDAFRAAVEEAVRQWRFRPGELRTLRQGVGANGERFWLLLSRERAECALDVEFIFTASGDVTTNLPNK